MKRITAHIDPSYEGKLSEALIDAGFEQFFLEPVAVQAVTFKGLADELINSSHVYLRPGHDVYAEPKAQLNVVVDADMVPDVIRLICDNAGPLQYRPQGYAMRDQILVVDVETAVVILTGDTRDAADIHHADLPERAVIARPSTAPVREHTDVNGSGLSAAKGSAPSPA